MENGALFFLVRGMRKLDKSVCVCVIVFSYSMQNLEDFFSSSIKVSFSLYKDAAAKTIIESERAKVVQSNYPS